ncbi:hypothetical protein O1611_g6927 [Lasiodiplodia mahajangana]|uniref:Uncharacterized protein n=1 Tax=Lasiodiplodia mahajangana TaxID=1108764 RepID=A0ACC2JGR4_9PEZI|nr:hypothetical protein O1611_g6927 [Lasiodiplodia mahajangana]
MTGHSPRLWATANLDPISPSPIHPPSPVTVPALQDQADVYSDMSLAGANPIALAAASSARVPERNGEQSHVPVPAPAPTPTRTVTVVNAVAIHNNTPNGLPDAKLGYVGSTGSKEKAVNGEARRAEMASASMIADNMQEPETSQSDTTKAGQHVLELNESTSNSDTSTLASRPAQLATSVHENNHPISQVPHISADISSRLVPQPPYELLGNGEVISNSIVSSIDSTRVSQALSEQSLANSNHYSCTIGHVGDPVTNIQATVDRTATHVGNTDVVHISMPKSIAESNGLHHSTILPPKPPTPELLPNESLSSIPAASQSSVVPFPPSNGAAQNTFGSTVLGTVGSYASAPVVLGTNSMSNYAISNTGSESKHEPLLIDQSLSLNHDKQQYDTFLQEERKYVSEAKWDRFPDGSRIFIGNLSSERVSKREVFNIFSKCGRLAQISLKQAYGFIQYHTHAEGQAAMNHLQGIDIRGKKINLEVSRAQKKAGEGSRGNRARRDGDRHDSNRGRRDDYRPGRQHSPRRSSHRQLPSYDNNHRSRSYPESGYSSDRRRSQSPDYNRHDSYRRRSPSPRRRYASGVDLDLPPRYGPDIPDVQFLLLQDVRPDFIAWVEAAFVHEGLTVKTMFLHPRFPRDAVIQRQVLEGVHAVVELDTRSEGLGRVPLQLFDRSGGYDNVRYDKYQDLEPHIAAQLVARAKPPSLVTPAPYHSNYYPPAQHYPPPAQGYYMPPTYPSQHYPSPMSHNARNAPIGSDAVHKILGSLNGQQGRPPVDVNSLLATHSITPHQVARPPIQNGTNYGQPPPNAPQGVPYNSSSTTYVENIMTQLSRYTQ